METDPEGFVPRCHECLQPAIYGHSDWCTVGKLEDARAEVERLRAEVERLHDVIDRVAIGIFNHPPLELAKMRDLLASGNRRVQAALSPERQEAGS